jgi:RecA-family ATPase
MSTEPTSTANGPVQVTVVWGSSAPMDITEIEALVDLLPDEGIFTNKLVNGRDPAPPADGEYKAPIDVDDRLANVQFEGPGESKVRWTELQVSASLLVKGLSVQETVDTLLDELRVALADDPRVASWDWDAERVQIEKMAYGWIAKHPELSDRLPDGLREDFERKHEAGLHPRFVHAWHLGGWLVRGEKPFKQATAGQEAPAEAAPQAASKPPKVKIEATPFKRFNPGDLPCREWLYGAHYQRGIITATVGPGGGGKSSLNLVELIAMCTGRNLLGEQPLVRCRAWYHNAEDGPDEIYLRIAAVLQHYNISQDELEGWLFVTSGLTMPIRVGTSRLGRPVIEAATVEAVINTITTNEIGVTSFDPLIATHSSVENVTGEMDMVIREFARIANVTECSIEIVHHTRKPAPGQEELGVVDSRGAGAIIDAVRSARVLNRMSKTEADKIHMDEADRLLHFRVDKGKANMAPPAVARWYKFKGVELPNGEDVGVVTAWQHPDYGGAVSEVSEAANRATDHVFITLLTRFTVEGRKASASPGANYAPNLFCKEREAKVAKVSKEALASAMRRLFEARKIRVEEAGTGTHRNQRLVIV